MSDNNKNNIVGIIPARMASTRFPGKPLADIAGKPMIHHVYWRSKMSKVLREVYIATCDNEIEEYCKKNGINVVMTKDIHQRASDRAAEAMLRIEQATKERIDILVMIQGDEPMLYPEMIEESVKPMLEDGSIDVVNLMSLLQSEQDCLDENVVKVVADLNNFALYFSREPIPSKKKIKGQIPMYRQVAIIPFKRNILIKFNELKETPLEIIESVDMLRFLENGYKVKMALTKFNIYGVDTPQDLIKVNGLMKKDKLAKDYS